MKKFVATQFLASYYPSTIKLSFKCLFSHAHRAAALDWRNVLRLRCTTPRLDNRVELLNWMTI